MPVAGPLVGAEVQVVEDVALVKLINRTGSRIVFDVDGEETVVDGNTTGGVVRPRRDGFDVTRRDGGIVHTIFV